MPTALLTGSEVHNYDWFTAQSLWSKGRFELHGCVAQRERQQSASLRCA